MMRFYENVLKTSENRLHPRQYYIPQGACEYYDLNGKWSFKFFERDREIPDEITEWDGIEVPSCWQLKGYEHPNYANVAFPFPCDPPYVPDDNPCGVYQKEFEIPADDRKTYFILEGVSSCAMITVNGKYVGYTQGSHLQAEFDLTGYVVPGKNVLRVCVYKWCCGSYLEDQDFFRFNGIFRDTYLLRRPENHLTNLKISAADDCLKIDTDREADIALFNAEKELIAAVKNTASAEIKVENAIPWNAENPYLYTAEIRCAGEIITQKVGFRTIKISGDGELLINGTPVKLRGMNHHDTGKYNGWYQTREEIRNDLSLMKSLNVNCIRTSHYPPTPAFLEDCDELGFYVILETDLESHGFTARYSAESGYAGGYDVDGENGSDWPCNMPDWEKEHVERMQRAVILNQNHPGIIMWSTGNESGHGKNHVSMIKWLRTLDDMRLVHCEDACRKGDYTNVDVVSNMYHAPEDVEKFAKSACKKPFMLCEYAHAMGNGPGDVFYYNELFEKYKNIIGGCVWEWADHVVVDPDGVQRYGGDFPDEKTNDGNFCCDGIVFADRSFKAGTYELKAAYAPMRTVLSGNVLTIKNNFDFTNFDKCKIVLTVTGDDRKIFEKELQIALAPQKTADIPLPLEQYAAKYGVCLNCCLYKDGELLARTSHALPYAPVADRKKEEKAGLSEDREFICIKGPDFTYQFSKHLGTLTEITLKGKPILAGPVQLTALRAPTDNDRHIKSAWLNENPWLGENLNVQFSKIYDCSITDNTVTVRGSLAGVSRAPFFRYQVSYTFWGSGRIDVALSGDVGKYVCWLPRLGFEFAFMNINSDFSYYGYGPYESYCDMHNGSCLGYFNSNANEQYVPYVRPQEHGNHYKAKLLRLDGIEFTGENFEFNVSNYATEALLKAEHTDELVSDGRLHTRIDYKVSGLGSNSCGPQLAEKYRLNDKKIDFRFSVNLSPLFEEKR